MKYYQYLPDSNHFKGYGLDQKDKYIIDMHYQSQRLSPKWTPVVLHGFDDNPEVEGDFPSLSSYRKVPIFSRHALDVLFPLISDSIEVLPVVHPSGDEFFIINVLELLDCLDEEKSEVRRSQIDGRISRVFSYCFHPALIEGKHIFKTPLESGAGLFVDEEFKQLVEENNLKGLEFNELPMAE